MATFTAGQTLNLRLDYDDTISFQGQGVATITPTSGSVFTTYLTGNQTIGPFKQYVSLSILTSSAGSYTQSSLPAVALSIVDSNGNPSLVSPTGIPFAASGTYTWTQLQALTGQAAGTRAYVSTFNGAEFVYDGTRWRPV